MKKLILATSIVCLFVVVFFTRVRIKDAVQDFLKPDLPQAREAVSFADSVGTTAVISAVVQQSGEVGSSQRNETARRRDLEEAGRARMQPPPQSAQEQQFYESQAVGTGVISAAIDEPESLPGSINLSVPFASQAPFADWGMPYQEACEEAAVIMTDYFFKGRSLDPKTMNEEILKLVEWENRTFGYYQDTTAEEIARIFREYFGYQNVEVRYEFTIDDIKAEVAQGRPVVVPAAGRLLGNPNFRRPGPIYHALVIKGYTADKIITNDPGTRKGRDYLYDPGVLMNALHEWNAENILNGRKAMIVVKF